jgi:hypothetical protein
MRIEAIRPRGCRCPFYGAAPQPRGMQLGTALSISKVPRWRPGPLLPCPARAGPNLQRFLGAAVQRCPPQPLLLQAPPPPPQPHRAASALFLVPVTPRTE